MSYRSRKSEVVQRGMAEDLAQPVGRLRMLPEKSSLFQGLVLRFGGALWAPCCTLKRKNWGCFRLVYFSPEGGHLPWSQGLTHM